MTRPPADTDGGDDGARGGLAARPFRTALGVVLGVLAVFPLGVGLLALAALSGPWRIGASLVVVGVGLGLAARTCFRRDPEASTTAVIAVVVLMLGVLLLCTWGLKDFQGGAY